LIKSSAGQASVGQECWSSANGVVSGGCASGTQCGPWLPPGGTATSWDGVSPWYCLNTNTLASGASCNYDAKIGYCASGLSCCSGTCSTCSTDSTDSSSDSTTTGTGTTEATTTAACTIYAGEICDDTVVGSAGGYPKSCCDGLTCTAAANSTRTSLCGGSDIVDGSRCLATSVSGVTATCTSDSACQCTDSTDASTCTCTLYTDQAACSQSGFGYRSMCYNGDVQQQIKGTACCDSVTTHYCIASDEKPTGQAEYDRYCMPYKLTEGATCGLNSATNFAGACDSSQGLECSSSGVCATTPTTSAAPTTTTGTTTPAATTATCEVAGQACFANGVVTKTCCSGNCDGDWPIGGNGVMGYTGTGNCL